MSGNQSTQTGLNQRKHFEFQVEIEDPDTGLITPFPMEVDTGSPAAIVLPRFCSQFFNEYQGPIKMAGAASGTCPTYNANILSVDSLSMDFETMAIMGLDNSYDYGLLGIDFLKRVYTEIEGPPNGKTMNLEDTHLP